MAKQESTRVTSKGATRQQSFACRCVQRARCRKERQKNTWYRPQTKRGRTGNRGRNTEREREKKVGGGPVAGGCGGIGHCDWCATEGRKGCMLGGNKDQEHDEKHTVRKRSRELGSAHCKCGIASGEACADGSIGGPDQRWGGGAEMDGAEEQRGVQQTQEHNNGKGTRCTCAQTRTYIHVKMHLQGAHASNALATHLLGRRGQNVLLRLRGKLLKGTLRGRVMRQNGAAAQHRVGIVGTARGLLRAGRGRLAGDRLGELGAGAGGEDLDLVGVGVGLGARLEGSPALLTLTILLLVLLHACAVVGRALIKEGGVDLGENLERAVDERVNGSVPVRLGVLVERREHDGDDDRRVFRDEGQHIVVVEKVQGALGNLKVRARDAARQTLEERHLNLDKLVRLNDIQDLLNFVEEEHFLGAIDLGPEVEEHREDLLCQCRLLFQKLHDAVRQLRVVHAHALDLVQRQQYLDEKALVLILEGKGKAVDDAAENLEELGDAVVVARLVDKLEEDVVDGAADKRAQRQKLAVNAVQRRLEKVTLAGIFTAKKLEELKDKRLVNVLLGNGRLEVGCLEEAQEKLVHELEMGPGSLKCGLILLGVKLGGVGVLRGR
eukprot:m.223265 g.223265  ORF g.223265 m.223265 type:complete len:608 (-) comp10822_c3_seq1:2384-4207(-)